MKTPFARNLMLLGAILASSWAVRPASGEVQAWYELVGSASPGPNEVMVQQGGPGRPLRISTDAHQGQYQLRIRLVMDCPADEGLLAYAVDLTAPYSANALPGSFSYVSSFDYYFPPTLMAGPGPILTGASQFNFFEPMPDGEVELFEFVLTVARPPADRIEIYSAVGPAGWTRADGGPVSIVFGDSPALLGWDTGFISATPSIIIEQFVPVAPTPPSPPDDEREDQSVGGLPTQAPSMPLPVDHSGAVGGDSPIPAAGSADDLSRPAESPPEEAHTSRPMRIVDRKGLRSFLSAVFGLSMSEMPASAIVPAGISWALGWNVHGLLSVSDALGVPIRAMLVELTYAWMDAMLP